MAIEHFLGASPVVQVHALAAIGALAIGGMIYALPKGRLKHRVLGISCAVLLAVTAITAIFITGVNGDMWSFIHVFVPLTAMGIFGVAMAVRRRDFKKHKDAARGLIFGALLVPGILAFMPGRLMHLTFFG